MELNDLPLLSEEPSAFAEGMDKDASEKYMGLDEHLVEKLPALAEGMDEDFLKKHLGLNKEIKVVPPMTSLSEMLFEDPVFRKLLSELFAKEIQGDFKGRNDIPF